MVGLRQVIDNTVAAFLKYRNDASASAIDKAAQALTQAHQSKRRIEFYGVGNSGIVAQDAQHKFFRLGMNTIAYNTSKGALVNFTRTLAGEWGRHGITVNALAPGFFPSKMTKGLMASIGEEKLAAHAPLRRIGDDDDLKGAALLFASRAGKHITGQILAVDGGVSAVHGG